MTPAHVYEIKGMLCGIAAMIADIWWVTAILLLLATVNLIWSYKSDV